MNVEHRLPVRVRTQTGTSNPPKDSGGNVEWGFRDYGKRKQVRQLFSILYSLFYFLSTASSRGASACAARAPLRETIFYRKGMCIDL